MTKKPLESKVKLAPPPAPMSAGFVTKLGQAPTFAANNMTEKLQDMSFKVHPDFHFQFKLQASLARISMKDLLEQAFNLWLEKNAPKRD